MLTARPRFPVKQILLQGLLPSFIKRLLYRWKGYKIGRGVSFGFGSVVCGESVEIGDHTTIGFLTIIRGKSITLGAHVQIGSMAMFDTPHLEIGDGSKINEQVFVGGLQHPDSRLKIGRNCQIMQMTFINPTRSITIGDDTGIGGDCLLFGHSSWLSKFEGYDVNFEPIEIGKSVSLAWRVFVLPGARIGDGTVIGANSLVKGVVPPRCLAAGFPARVISRHPEYPREVSAGESEAILGDIVSELAKYLHGFGFECQSISKAGFEVFGSLQGSRQERRSRGRLSVIYQNNDGKEDLRESSGSDVLISLCSLSHSIRRKLEASGTVWVDIKNKERSDGTNDLGEEVIDFLKRYGVRLFRDHTNRPTTGAKDSKISA